MGSCGSIEEKNIIVNSRSRYDNSKDGKYILPKNIAQRADIKNIYQLSEEKLGKGKSGYVCIGVKNNKKYAIKRIVKAKLRNIQQMKIEAEISLKLNHKNIVKTYEYYEDDDYISSVMDLEEGGTLFDFISKSPLKFLPDDLSFEVFKQLCEVIDYIHNEQKIVHRDLKPENILMKIDENGKPQIKLIDFGSAAYLPENKEEYLKCSAGTKSYSAPEIMEYLGYREKVDEWSLGVILFNMLTGCEPFYGKNDAVLRERILFSTPKFDKIKNEDFKELDEKLLQRIINKRISAKECLAIMKGFNVSKFNLSNTVQEKDKVGAKNENDSSSENTEGSSINEQKDIKA